MYGGGGVHRPRSEVTALGFGACFLKSADEAEPLPASSEDGKRRS